MLYIARNPKERMHRRFWTVCAAANIFLFFLTSIMVYMRHDVASEFDIKMTRRSNTHWVNGMAVWRDFYRHCSNVSDASYVEFLPIGLAAVGCLNLEQAPSCRCLYNSHMNGACVSAAQKGMENCFMNMKAATSVEETEISMKPVALLNALNAWGMMCSVLIWIRMYAANDEVSMPYLMQLVLGSFAMVVHCAILEPSGKAFAIYMMLVVLICLLSFYHHTDTRWWVSTFMVQYLFSVPTLVLLNHTLTLKRDITLVAATMGLATVYGLVTFGRVLLDDLFASQGKETTADELYYQSNASVGCQVVLMMLFFGMTSLSYFESGFDVFQSTYVVWYLFPLYLGLGMIGVVNIKRICVTELLFRLCITTSLLFELSMILNKAQH